MNILPEAIMYNTNAKVRKFSDYKVSPLSTLDYPLKLIEPKYVINEHLHTIVLQEKILCKLGL